MAASVPSYRAFMPIPISEPAVVEDVFVMELVRIEPLGPCVRLSFAVEQVVPGTDPPQVELAVKAKIIIPVSSVGQVSTKLLNGEEIELPPDAISTLRQKAS